MTKQKGKLHSKGFKIIVSNPGQIVPSHVKTLRRRGFLLGNSYIGICGLLPEWLISEAQFLFPSAKGEVFPFQVGAQIHELNCLGPCSKVPSNLFLQSSHLSCFLWKYLCSYLGLLGAVSWMEKGERWKLCSLKPLGLVPLPSTGYTKRKRSKRRVKNRSGWMKGSICVVWRILTPGCLFAVFLIYYNCLSAAARKLNKSNTMLYSFFSFYDIIFLI